MNYPDCTPSAPCGRSDCDWADDEWHDTGDEDDDDGDEVPPDWIDEHGRPHWDGATLTDDDDQAALEEQLGELLDQIHGVLTDYVAFPSPAGGDAATVWVVHCHARAAFESTPRLAALSPEPGSGKTRLLEAIEVMVPRPVFAVNITPSALFRMVAEGDATLLLDEADTYLGRDVIKQHEDIRGLVNAGHRRSGVAYRTEMNGKVGHVVEFPAFAPVALAGIGDLPDTIMDRSIVLAMKRRAKHEKVIPFREREARARTAPIRVSLAKWAIANHDRLAAARPDMPDGIVDRAADVWEPLIAIGDMAGRRWQSRVRDAAAELTSKRAARPPSLGLQLLIDCQTVFEAAAVDRLRTEDLLGALTGLDERPWENIRGEALNARGLAWRLKPYDIAPGTHRFGADVGRGYLRSDFADAWSRYVPGPSGDPPTSATSATSDPDVAHVADVNGSPEGPASS